MRYLFLYFLIVVFVTLVAAATFTVETDPPGLNVWKDGVYIGTAPVTIGISPLFEKRGIVVTGEGYEEITRELSRFWGGSVTIRAERVKVLVVVTEPPGLKVLIDDEYVGDGPVSLDGPFYRDFEITVTGEGYEEVTESIMVGWEGYEKKIVIAPEKKE